MAELQNTKNYETINQKGIACNTTPPRQELSMEALLTTKTEERLTRKYKEKALPTQVFNMHEFINPRCF